MRKCRKTLLLTFIGIGEHTKSITRFKNEHIMKTRILKRIAAYSLTEVLVVLVIIGILVLLALPNLMPLITRAKSTEAKLQLQHIHTLQKNHFFERSLYSTDLIELGYEQEKLVTEGGQSNYLIEIISADATQFTARAIAVVDFNSNGTYNVWEIDQDKNLREIIKD